MKKEEMKERTLIGTCRFCGQQMAVEAYNEAEADAKATAECKCEEGKIFRRKEECINRIADLCQAPRTEAGVMPLPAELVAHVRTAADFVAIGALDGVSIDFKGTTIKLRPGTEEKPVKFSRSWKLEIEN